MRNSIVPLRHFHPVLAVVALSTLLLFSLLGMVAIAHADGPLSGAGYLDFSYGTTVKFEPTAEKPESKLWWNDGIWWASLYNDVAGEYRIYRLNWGTQTWEDTRVTLDDREEARADVLWDEASGKLYVVSHIAVPNGRYTSNDDDRGRLYRYSYDEPTQIYSLDGGFPVIVNQDKTESLVLAKDFTDRLWVTYASSAKTASDYQIFVNATSGDDLTWGTPFTIPVTSTHVISDDLSSVVAFRDDTGDKVGIMWSNQVDNTFNFAVHDDSNSNPETGWNVHTINPPDTANDHVNIKSLQTTSSGQVFAAVRTGAITDTDTLVGLVARDTDGSFSFHEYSTVADADTRPILLIDEGDLGVASDDQVHIFVTGKAGGGRICYKSADITAPLSGMSFPTGNCGIPFIEDNDVNNIDNSTSTKQNVNNTTGLVVMASDDVNGQVYVHNFLGDPPPVVTSRGPERDEWGVQVNAVVTATFSKEMNASTLNSNNFTVEDGSGPVAGNVSYDSGTRTATFTPDNLLKADTTHTVKLDDNIRDTRGNRLFGTGTIREEWSFTTGSTTVQFSDPSYSVTENDGTASITVTLNTSSSISVAVDVNYATSDGTATAGIDYESTSGTLTFDPGVTNQSFGVTILLNTITEGDRTVNLTLSAPVNAHLGEPYTATLTIVDDAHYTYLPILLRNHTD